MPQRSKSMAKLDGLIKGMDVFGHSVKVHYKGSDLY